MKYLNLFVMTLAMFVIFAIAQNVQASTVERGDVPVESDCNGLPVLLVCDDNGKTLHDSDLGIYNSHDHTWTIVDLDGKTFVYKEDKIHVYAMSGEYIAGGDLVIFQPYKDQGKEEVKVRMTDPKHGITRVDLDLDNAIVNSL